MAVARKTSLKIGIALIGLVAIGGGLRYVQLQTEGLKNALSPKYWADRAKGEDEYVPSLAYLKRGPRDKKEVVLTLDDGPHGQCTIDELAAMKAAGIKATFFVVGKQMVKYPDLVKQMIDEGMEVGNHTETHPRLDTLTADGVKKEIEECDANFERITGRRMTLFRPPGMHENPAILKLIKDLGHQTIGWNTGAQDFMPSKKDKGVTMEYIESLKATPDQISDRITAHVKNGSIILLHDQPTTAAALPKIISTLQDAGYKFVTCAEAMAHIDHPVDVVSDPVLPEKASAEKLPSERAAGEKLPSASVRKPRS